MSCCYAKPVQLHSLEFCENGAKATAWEITSKRWEPEFFGTHTVTEPNAGRITLSKRLAD